MNTFQKGYKKILMFKNVLNLDHKLSIHVYLIFDKKIQAHVPMSPTITFLFIDVVLSLLRQRFNKFTITNAYD